MGSEQLLILLVVSTFTALVLVVLALRYRKKRSRETFIVPEMGDWKDTVPEDGVVSEVRVRRVEAVNHEEAGHSLGFDVMSEVVPAVPAKRRKRSTVDSIIALHVMAPEGRPFVGYEMLQTLLSLGMRYGEMNIFHRYEHTTGEGKRWFSLASAVEPGIFDLSTMGGLACPGLTFFMNAADHPNPMTIFDVMLETARQLAEDLGGEMQESQHQPLNDYAIAKYREQIRRL